MAVDLPPPADTPAISAALTETNVRVSADFRGARIVLYGAVFQPDADPADVVVIVRGPDQPVRITRKVRVAGLWLNSRPVVFQGAPGFYMAASNRPLDEVATFGTLRRWERGSTTCRSTPRPSGASRPATAFVTWWSPASAPTTTTGAARSSV
ncbi:TIGR02186 family protein [Phenylobacterium sp. J426]|uniref:TIGR02186 family protein n=1 Tax=Phenylobacterium sp. J426 TaxID=2898439 RepID=UPI002150EE16|nr:TIGR02186 family protein [Phenylobacterium sp. J426]MCR5873039.1 TIGR02186 family protein [Phenylobacterium sp. J426]